MPKRRDRLYPYRGRIIRPQEVPSGNDFGAERTRSGHRYVLMLHDRLQFSRRMSENQGERALYRAGTIGDVQFRFQTPVYLPDVRTSDELAVLEDDMLVLYNIVTPAPHVGRAGLGGKRIGEYTVILAQRKAAQNAEMDIYL